MCLSVAGDIWRISGDDIDAVCTLYQVTANVQILSPTLCPCNHEATADFGEKCRDAQCVAPLFCVDDGTDVHCSLSCTPGDRAAPAAITGVTRSPPVVYAFAERIHLVNTVSIWKWQ